MRSLASRFLAVSDHSGSRGLPSVVSGTLWFLLGNALLGSIGVFVHEAQAAPITTTWFRCAFGLIGLTLWVLWRGAWRSLWVGWRTLPWVLLLGSGMLASWWLFFTALHHVPAGMAVVLFHVQPLWLLLLGVWWLKESVSRRRLASVSCAMVGLVLATGVLQGKAAAGSGSYGLGGYGLGVGLCLLGALFTAGVTLVAKRLQALPVGVLAWWQCALGTAVLWWEPWRQGWPTWGPAWAWLAGLGLVHTALAYTLMYVGMARLPTARVAVLQFAYPVVAIGMDAVYFKEPLHALQLLGVALMMGAMGLGERRNAAR